MQTPRKKHKTRRFFYFLLYSIIIYVLLEGIAWLADLRTGFREKLIESFDLMEVRNEPITAKSQSHLPEPLLALRSPDLDQASNVPYRAGRRLIRNACPLTVNIRVTPEQLSADPEKRIFIIGGSAAYGFPYAYQDTFAAILNQELQEYGYQVLNASRVGATTGDLVPIAKRIVDYFTPSILIIYTGNNEWIHWVPENQPWISKRRLRVFRILAHSRVIALIQYWSFKKSASRISEKDQEAIFKKHKEIEGASYALEHPGEDLGFDTRTWVSQKQLFLETFRSNLSQMIQYAQARNVRVVVFTVPFNYKLSPAWKHPQPESFDPEHTDTVREAIQTGYALFKEKKYVKALDIFDNALRLDPAVPVLHHLRGQCLEALNRPAAAEIAYAQCRENMVGNLGSRLSINQVIVQTAEAADAEILDIAGLFDTFEHARGRYFNQDLIHDDCHPNPLGHRVIASAVLELLDQNRSSMSTEKEH